MKRFAHRTAIVFGGLVIASFAAPAAAQVPVQAPARGGTDVLLTNPQGGDGAFSSDPFSQTGSGQMSSMMELMQRAISGGYVPLEDFNRQQSTTISNEASDFRSRQLELLQQQTQPTAPASTTP